ELGRFAFRPGTLTAQVSPLVLHGKEAEGEPPFLYVESIALGLRIISPLERKVDLASVRIQNPHARIVIYPDGSTNLPNPAEHLSGKSWAEQMIDVAVRQYEISNGLVEFDDRKIPLNLRGEGLELKAAYDARTPAYRVELNSDHFRILPG